MQTMTLGRSPTTIVGRTGERRLVRRPVPLRERVTVRLRTPASRELVARSLTQLVEDDFLVDACSPFPHLRHALEESIAAATESAVETLIDELADLLDLLPETAVNAWDRARHAADFGYE